MALLELNNLHVYYGAIHALKGISMKVEKGQVVALIGANGAGKTTTLRTISGLLHPREGSIMYDGKPLHEMKAQAIVKAGISQVPEGRRIFAPLTVMENLELGAFLRNDKEGIKADMETIFQSFPRLKERTFQRAGTLSGGEQQMLAMGRALMSRPKVLLLDEPSMGLSPIFVQEIFNIIQKINEEGTTVLLVEQNARMALSIADYAYVLETGTISLEGKGADLAASKEVQKAYLGG